MLQHEMAEKLTGTIDIVDVEPDIMNQILRYIYTGQRPHLDDYLTTAKFLAAAEKYDFPVKRHITFVFSGP